MDHLADAPVANILILAGIIFLAVAIFGRVGGFIGKIFGNIEAAGNSRLLAGVLGALLTVAGGWLHVEGDKSAASKTLPSVDATVQPVSPSSNQPTGGKATSADTPNDRFVGTWTNVLPPSDPTDGLFRIEIVRTPKSLDGHFLYKIGGQDLDRGVHPLTATGDKASYDFNDRDRHFIGSMSLYAQKLLLVSVDAFEPGTTRRWHKSKVLARSTLSTKTQDAFSRYHAGPGEKAFAMTPSGQWAYHLQDASSHDAAQGVLQKCEQHSMHDCKVILLNGEGTE